MKEKKGKEKEQKKTKSKISDSELTKIPGVEEPHKKRSIEIRGNIVNIDEGIVDLVKNLNDFTTKDGRRPFVSFSSCQEHYIDGRIGGITFIRMTKLNCADVNILSKILLEAVNSTEMPNYDDMPFGSNRMASDVSLRIIYNREYDYIYELEIDSSMPNRSDVITDSIKSSRKRSIDAINNSLKKFSGKLY